nr:disulfide-bond oxidoreductase yfcg [Quercus suber]
MRPSATATYAIVSRPCSFCVPSAFSSFRPYKTPLPLHPRPSFISSSIQSKNHLSFVNHSRRHQSTQGTMSSNLYIEQTPAEVKNAKGLHLLTMNTPNGQAVQIFLEELKDAYGLEWSTTLINIMENTQKEEWFLRLDPNGQVHHFSRAAPEKIEYAINRFKNETLRVYGVLEIHLSGKYADAPRDFLAGHGKGKYSVADIKTWPWVKGWERSGFTQQQMADFPHLLQWIDRVAARPAVQRGISEKYQK